MILLPIHVVAGGAAIILGAAALLAAKGRPLHRRAGLLFVCALLLMGISGSLLAATRSLTNVNVLGGLVCAYFTVTALTTVRPVSVWTRRLNAAAISLGLALALVEFGLGFSALARPSTISGCAWCHTVDGVPFFMLLFMATIMMLAVAGDVRALRVAPRARARLARHLWRMCFALFIAAGSFFSVPERVAKILPQAFATPVMRSVPVAGVFVAMFYWLWYVRARQLPTRRG